MPRIPTSRRQVQERAVSPGSVSARGPQRAQTNIAGQSAQLVGQVGEFVQRERNKAMDTKLKEMELEFINERNRALVQGEEGFLNKKGQNTAALYNDYNNGFSKFVDERVGSLGDSELQERANLLATKYKQNFTYTLDRHTAGEMSRYHDQVNRDLVKGIQDSAAINYKANVELNNLGQVNKDLQSMQESLVKYAASKGMNEDQTKMLVREEESKFHVSVLNSAIQNGDSLIARDYYKSLMSPPDVPKLDEDGKPIIENGKPVMEKQQPRLTGQASTQMKKLIDNAVLLGESQRLTEEIMKEGAGYQESLELAKSKASKDPELYKEVRRSVKNRLAEREMMAKQNKTQMFEYYSANLEQTRSLSDLKRSQGWLALDQRQRQALEAREAQLIKVQEPKTKMAVYHALRQQASDPEGKNDFLSSPLMEYRPYLSDSDFKYFSKLQADMREGGDKADKIYKGLYTVKQVEEGLLRDLNLSDEEKDLFRKRMDGEVEAWKMDNQSSQIPNNIVRDIGEKLLEEEVLEKGFLWDTKTRRFKLPHIDDVPKEVKDKIKAKYGKKVTDAEIIKIYQEFKATNG